MNYGKWFTLDLEASDLRNGIAIFNYRGFKFYKEEAKNEFEAEIDGNRTTPEYPIFATISSNGIHFCCHYALISSTLMGRMNDGPLQIYHQDNEILSLEFSGNAHASNDLNHRIDEAFCAIYPRKDNPIEDGIGDEFFKQFKRQTLRPIDKVEGEKGVTYSSLGVFRTSRIGEDDTITEYYHFVVRKLFLDFLYDFEHTDVFKNSSHYDVVYERLHNNLLFDAIAKKAEYYYHRKICEQLFFVGNVQFKDKNYYLVNLEHYVNSERNWVECILNRQSDKLFYESNWIISTKKELDNVYRSSICCADYLEKIRKVCIDLDDNVKINEISKTITSSAKQAHAWYLHKYDLGGSMYVLFGERNAILWLFMCIPPFFPIARRIYGTRKTTRMVGTIEMFMPRMFAAIFAAWFSLYSFVDRYINEWNSPIPHNDHSTNLLLPGIIFTIVVMFIFLYSEIKRKTLYTFEDHKTELSKHTNLEGTIIRRLLSILFIGLEYSALSSIFIYNMVGISGNSLQVLFSLLIVMFIGIFVQMIFDDRSVSESFK